MVGTFSHTEHTKDWPKLPKGPVDNHACMKLYDFQEKAVHRRMELLGPTLVLNADPTPKSNSNSTPTLALKPQPGRNPTRTSHRSLMAYFYYDSDYYPNLHYYLIFNRNLHLTSRPTTSSCHLTRALTLFLILIPALTPTFLKLWTHTQVIVTGGWDRSLRVYDEAPREGDPPLLRQVSFIHLSLRLRLRAHTFTPS